MAFSQASDFIVVKKRNGITLKSYFPGIPITFQMVDTRWVDGYITAIRNDSVFVKQYDVRTVPTIWGVTMLDTAGSYIVPVYYKEIKQVVFDKNRKAFSFVTDGTIFMVGGLGYALLNVVNGKYLHEPITSSANMGRLGIALGVAGAGFALNRIQHKAKKMHIEYIHMNEIKNKQLRAF